MNVKIGIIQILLLFILTDTFGQIDNFRYYQDSKNRAELKIIEGNKIDALNIYYNLLTISNGNFSKDIYNSLILATELNKLDTFFILLELVKQKNFDNKYLESVEEFKTLHNDKRWRTFIKTNNEVIYIDTALRTQINKLEFTDQCFRKKKGSYQIYGDTINKIDSINIAFVLDLMTKRGLPGEKEIGASDFFGKQGYDIVLWHHCQARSMDERQLNLTPFLVKSVQEGRIEPNKCAQILELQNGEFRSGNDDICAVKFNDKETEYMTYKYSDKYKMLIEAYRKLIYLESLEDLYKKIKYVTHNADNKFRFDLILNTTVVGSEQEFIDYQKSMMDIK